jgi:hypothetical protein
MQNVSASGGDMTERNDQFYERRFAGSLELVRLARRQALRDALDNGVEIVLVDWISNGPLNNCLGPVESRPELDQAEVGETVDVRTLTALPIGAAKREYLHQKLAFKNWPAVKVKR